MVVKNYTTYLTESLNLDDLYLKLSDSHTELKKDLIEIINITLEESSDIKNIKSKDLNVFFSDFIADGKNSDLIDSLIEDNDIFNFYLKHQSSFDELLNDIGYMEKSPHNNGIFSLYDIIIDGTKQGIYNVIEIMQSELF